MYSVLWCDFRNPTRNSTTSSKNIWPPCRCPITPTSQTVVPTNIEGITTSNDDEDKLTSYWGNAKRKWRQYCVGDEVTEQWISQTLVKTWKISCILSARNLCIRIRILLFHVFGDDDVSFSHDFSSKYAIQEQTVFGLLVVCSCQITTPAALDVYSKVRWVHPDGTHTPPYYNPRNNWLWTNCNLQTSTWSTPVRPLRHENASVTRVCPPIRTTCTRNCFQFKLKPSVQHIGWYNVLMDSNE